MANGKKLNCLNMLGHSVIGNTMDFGSIIQGSSPCAPAKIPQYNGCFKEAPTWGFFFCTVCDNLFLTFGTDTISNDTINR